MIERKKINDIGILEEIYNIVHYNNDARASWFGPYLPDTDIQKYKPYANWAQQHWSMYYGFLNFITDFEKGYKILDAGCGVGYDTILLSNFFKNSNILGIDLCEKCVELGLKYNKNKNTNFKVDNVITHKSEEKYDYIFALEIMEHLPSDEHHNFIDNLLSNLKEGGLIFLTTPNDLDMPDQPNEHIGLLNRHRAKIFIDKYKSRFHYTGFYNNKNLLDPNPLNYTIEEDITTYEDKKGVKSHFKIIIK